MIFLQMGRISFLRVALNIPKAYSSPTYLVVCTKKEHQTSNGIHAAVDAIAKVFAPKRIVDDVMQSSIDVWELLIGGLTPRPGILVHSYFNRYFYWKLEF
jgi:hypothetical protein